MNLRDLLPPALRKAGTPIRRVRIHSPESIMAAAQQPGTLANRVLQGLVSGKPVHAPPEHADFVDYLARSLTKQLLDSEKKGAFALQHGEVDGLVQRWSKQPCMLLDCPDQRPGTSTIVRTPPKPAVSLLETIADPDREEPWTIVVHPEQWEVAAWYLEQAGFEILNRDAQFTAYEE